MCVGILKYCLFLWTLGKMYEIIFNFKSEIWSSGYCKKFGLNNLMDRIFRPNNFLIKK